MAEDDLQFQDQFQDDSDGGLSDGDGDDGGVF